MAVLALHGLAPSNGGQFVVQFVLVQATLAREIWRDMVAGSTQILTSCFDVFVVQGSGALGAEAAPSAAAPVTREHTPQPMDEDAGHQ